jgi:UDP:flavonoid glycosyltransferase YjiC (YdhE family)
MAEFLLMPFGSAGDTYPFIGLGWRLRERGHEVTLIANGHFRAAVRKQGLRFQQHGSEEEYLEALKNPDIWHPTKGFKAVVGHPRMPETVQEQHQLIAEHVHRNPNIVVVAGSLALGARLAQETHGVRLATVHLSPGVFLSIERPPALPISGFLKLFGKTGIRLVYWLGNTFVINPTMHRNVGRLRKEMYLPKEKRYFTRWIHSPELVLAMFPPWYAEPASDWPSQVRLTGFPLHDVEADQPLSPEVIAYLQAGEPPLVFTFGSAMKHGHRLFQAAVDASYRLRRRCLLLTPFPEQLPDPLPRHAFCFDYVPLKQLLPYAAALIHHGGIGTTAQALHAGVPQLITPLAHDQFDNAARVQQLRAGDVLPGRQVTPKRLAKQLRRLLADRGTYAALQRIAALSAQQRGLDLACVYLEELSQRRGMRPTMPLNCKKQQSVR